MCMCENEAMNVKENKEDFMGQFEGGKRPGKLYTLKKIKEITLT